ncbi:hypothetical protein [Verrucosispora sp. SN26_14.1]|uniref:hypothetical protein n=1 Tax=Verrucosispora sp. SN26_14.1 TaxID=2527879 RepID=UPI001375C6BE|nr:hypothetical protein [Verrucosispora sp. SN26_14.1]
MVATDPTTGRTAIRPVTALIVGLGSKNLVEITKSTRTMWRPVTRRFSYTIVAGVNGTPDENYSPEAISARSAANGEFYETPQDIHDLVTDVLSNPNYPQQMTGPARNLEPDVYKASGAPRAAQRWKDSAIYDNGDPRSQARILIDGGGRIAYVGRRQDGSHNYKHIIPYPWATRS